MGKRGRFGKYGEIKRVERLRRARKTPSFLPRPDVKPSPHGPAFRKSIEAKAPVKIRVAQPADARFIIELSGRVFGVYGPYKKTIMGWLESGMTLTLLAHMSKRPVGFVMISLLPQDVNGQHVSELLAIAVVPEEQRVGVGQMLLIEVEKKAAEMNIKELFLHTAEENMAAQKLFSKNGYERKGVKKAFYPAGQNALIMSKKISGDVQGTPE